MTKDENTLTVKYMPSYQSVEKMEAPEKPNLEDNKPAATMPRRSERIENRKRKFDMLNQEENSDKATVGNLQSSSTLTTINEDCLRRIVYYLNIADVVNMAIDYLLTKI